MPVSATASRPAISAPNPPSSAQGNPQGAPVPLDAATIRAIADWRAAWSALRTCGRLANSAARASAASNPARAAAGNLRHLRLAASVRGALIFERHPALGQLSRQGAPVFATNNHDPFSQARQARQIEGRDHLRQTSNFPQKAHSKGGLLVCGNQRPFWGPARSSSAFNAAHKRRIGGGHRGRRGVFAEHKPPLHQSTAATTTAEHTSA